MRQGKLRLALIGALVFVMAFGLVAPAAAQPPEKVRVFVTFTDQPGPKDLEIVQNAGGRIHFTYQTVSAISTTIPETAIPGLLRNPRITSIEPVGEIWLLEQEVPWGISAIGADTVHGYNKGAGIKVGVIDTGAEYTHLDLDANFDHNKDGFITPDDILGYDFAGTTLSGPPDPDPKDYHGHGTHVSGTVAAEDNDFGVVGVAPEAWLYALKVFDDSGNGTWDLVIAALEWAQGLMVDTDGDGVSDVQGVKMDVVNMSIGGSTGGSTLVEDACNAAYGAGLVLVASAGNSGNPPGRGDTIEEPASYQSVIAVAAVDSNLKRARWSSTGDSLELSAPGVSVKSTYLNGGYTTFQGTSMASPHVAGTVALVLANGTLTDENWDEVVNNVDVRLLLQRTADPLGDAWLYGYGLVDADEAAPPTGNLPPVANAGPDQTVTDSDGDGWEDVTLDGSTSYDPDGTIDAYKWAEGENVLGTEVSIMPSFAVGTHTVTLTVTDNEGATGTDEVIITVKEPTAADPMRVASVDVSFITRTAGPNTFYTALAKVTVVDADGLGVEGVTVSGHWEIATTDSDSGVTDANGEVSLESNRVKNPSAGTEFKFVIDNVTKEGWEWTDSPGTISGSKTV